MASRLKLLILTRNSVANIVKYSVEAPFLARYFVANIIRIRRQGSIYHQVFRCQHRAQDRLLMTTAVLLYATVQQSQRYARRVIGVVVVLVIVRVKGKVWLRTANPNTNK